MAATPPESAFRLEALGARYTIQVEAPPPASAPGVGDAPLPVLLCLDGDDQFALLRRARAALIEAGRPPSPLLLVGVGYGASYQEPGNLRARDYTPVPIVGAQEGGGAAAFLEFLVRTLWPALEARYSISQDTRGIAGHSLGALFALCALFRPAPFFNRVLASAPSIWWGERALLGRVEALRAAHATLTARVFLSVGGRDSRSMRSDLDDLERRLDAQPFAGLEIHRERFPRKNHFNSIIPGFEHGLAALYPAAAPLG